MSLRAPACAAFIVVLAAPALAQPTPSPSPPEIVHVTTADRQDEPITMTTRPTYVVDRAQIQATGSRTVADALRLVPGVGIFRYGGFGGAANYGVLGATSQQTLVLLNGFPVAASSIGEIDLGSFSTAGVDRIEVVEGGGSTLYGSSAVGGIINIITGHESKTPYAEIAAGTLGERDARIETGFGGLGLAWERHIATNVYDFPAMEGFPAGTRANAQAAASAVRLDYHSNLTPRYSFDAALGDDAVTANVPGNLGFLTPHAMQGTAQQDGHLTITRRGDRSALSLSLSAAHQALAFNDPDNGGESDTYDSRTQISLRDVIGSERSSFVGGIDLSRESALLDLGAASVPPNATAALSQSALYAQYRDAVARKVTLTVGARGEHDAPAGSVLVPSLGALAQFGVLRLTANYAGSFRAPTIDDLYFPGFSNPLLAPERAKDLDTGAELALAGASVSLHWFDRQATNLIALDQNFVPQNVAQASLGGFIFSARTAPMGGIVATLGITDLYRALNDTPGQAPVRLDFQPVIVTQLGLEKGFGGGRVAFGANAQVRGAHFEQGGTIFRDGETTFDAYVRGRLAPSTVLTVRARNIGDARYAPILGYPAPGRTVEFELSTK